MIPFSTFIAAVLLAYLVGLHIGETSERKLLRAEIEFLEKELEYREKRESILIERLKSKRNRDDWWRYGDECPY